MMAHRPAIASSISGTGAGMSMLPHSLGMNRFTPASTAASMSWTCTPAASSLRVQMTASWPVSASTRAAWDVSSHFLTSTPDGKVAVDSVRLRTETLKDLLARRAAVIGAPIVPLAYYNRLTSPTENREYGAWLLTPTMMTFLSDWEDISGIRHNEDGFFPSSSQWLLEWIRCLKNLFGEFR